MDKVFYRLFSQMRVIQRNRISSKCHPKCLIGQSTYDQTEARRWKDNTVLVGSMTTESSDAHMGHQASTSSWWKVGLPGDSGDSFTWWRQEMEMLALWEGNQPVIGGFLSQVASNAGHWCFLWSKVVHAIEQKVELPVNQFSLPPMCRHCNETHALILAPLLTPTLWIDESFGPTYRLCLLFKGAHRDCVTNFLVTHQSPSLHPFALETPFNNIIPCASGRY